MKRIIGLVIALTFCGAMSACLPQAESSAVKTTQKMVQKDSSNCIVCHGNKEFLEDNRKQFLAFEKANAEDKVAEEGTEEGSPTAQQLAVGLFVDLQAMGSHSDIDCESCHKTLQEGTSTPDWHAAIVTDPTADGGQVCASCHGQEMIDNFKASLHFTTNGVAKGLCERLKQTPDAQPLFEDVFYEPEMYMGCNTCHATCGQCHVSNPNIVGGGLIKSHSFGKPTAEISCNPCHYENSEYHLEVDVHATKHSMSCLDCHTDLVEFHGRPIADLKEGKLHYKGPDNHEIGLIESDMKSGIVQVTCVQCHQDKTQNHPVEGVDHFAKMECSACHTMPYANCFGCHNGEKPEYIGAWGNGDPETLNVKLGLSVPADPTSKLTTLNHVGMTEGAFGEGAPVVDTKNPETKAMWKPFAAHFITTAPLVSDAAKASGKTCDNCHSGNLDIFLKIEDLDLGGNDPVSDINLVVPIERLPKH